MLCDHIYLAYFYTLARECMPGNTHSRTIIIYSYYHYLIIIRYLAFYSCWFLQLFWGAITEILLDESYNFDTTESKACLSLAHKSIALLSSESTQHKQFADWIYAKLSSVIDKLCSGQKLMKIICGKSCILFTLSLDLCDKWKLFFTQGNLEPYPMFYQDIMQE